MANDAAAKSQKKSWFEGVKAEFKKIIWTDKSTLVKQTIVVVAVTIILCIIISIMDAALIRAISLVVK